MSIKSAMALIAVAAATTACATGWEDRGSSDLASKGSHAGGTPAWDSLDWPDQGNGDPTADDWDFIQIVRDFQAKIPDDQILEIQGRGLEDLLHESDSTVWEQSVDDGRPHGLHQASGPLAMVVEHTQGVIPVPLETFLEVLPPNEWGMSLDHYFGGDVREYDWDTSGRVTHQLERMILNQIPFDGDLIFSTCLNGDMTKVEIISYEDDRVVVDWRVMYSGNNTTESDVGSVAFERVDNNGQDHTLITFHSAHYLLDHGAPVESWQLMLPLVGLGAFFEDHIDHYRDLVLDRYLPTE